MINRTQQNVELIEERLVDIKSSLSELYKEISTLKKQQFQPSPGLLNAIRMLEDKQEAFAQSRELWRVIAKVYPNY